MTASHSLSVSRRNLTNRARRAQAQMVRELAEQSPVDTAIFKYGHYCKDHPISMETARLLCPEAREEIVEKAVALANGQPHDPFENLV